MPVTLHSLKPIRTKTNGLTKEHVAAITAAAGRPITIERLKQLENGPVRAEPWFDEACDLARILLLPGITPMMWDPIVAVGRSNSIMSGDLTQFVLGPSEPNEVELLRRGVRMPLSM